MLAKKSRLRIPVLIFVARSTITIRIMKEDKLYAVLYWQYVCGWLLRVQKLNSPEGETDTPGPQGSQHTIRTIPRARTRGFTATKRVNDDANKGTNQ